MLRPLVAFLTDVGRQRSNNEDNGWAHTFDEPHPYGVLAVAVVADGVGGHAAGEVASEIAVQAVRDVFEGEPTPHGTDIPALLQAAVTCANDGVLAWAAERNSGVPLTTIVICAVTDSTMYMASLGDSRGYVVTPFAVEQITEDDSFIADAVRKGDMTPEQAETSPLRNRLERAVGAVEDATVRIYTRLWDPQELILLCSDGLYEYVKPSDMIDVWKLYEDPEAIAKTVVDLANQRGGGDNITVCLLRHPNFRPLAKAAVESRGPRTIETLPHSGTATQEAVSALPFEPRGPSPDNQPTPAQPRWRTAGLYASVAIVAGIILGVQSFFIVRALARPAPAPAEAKVQPTELPARLSVEATSSSISIRVPEGFQINPPTEKSAPLSAVTFKLSQSKAEYVAGVLDAANQKKVKGGLRLVIGKAEALESFPEKLLKERALDGFLEQRIKLTTAADINGDSPLVTFSVTKVEPNKSSLTEKSK